MKRKLLTVVIGFAAFAVGLWLLFPLGCSDFDAGPGVGPQRGGCPQNDTHIGLLWPNIGTGLVFAPLVALIVGVAVGRYAWRRL